MIATRCIPVQAWPVPDQIAWMAALTSGDLLKPDGLAAHWSAATRGIIVKGYGRWIAWLGDTGQLDPAALPATRVTPERVAEYVGNLRERNASSTVAARVRQLQEALRVMAPGTDFTRLRRVVRALRALATPARLKRHRIRSPRELFALGAQLMHRAEAEELRRSPRHRAVLYRDGLMIALLSCCSVRLRNLLSLRIGQHVMRRDDVYWIVLQREETKTKRPLEVPLPRALTAAIDRYLEQHRPWLLRRPRKGILVETDALWISDRSSTLSRTAAHYRLTTITKRELGVSINPHLFRDCAATAIMIEDPEHARIAAIVLGHASLATTERYYVQAQVIEAARRYQGFILERRRQLLKSESGGQ
jgi:site-specific recombinase XerD